ncbi:MAG: thiamine phosphate synthase [Candidatus Acidiferrales bacterium]
MKPANKPIVCYVTDRKSSTSDRNEAALTSTLLQNIQAALAAGADWIQVREKDLRGGQLLEVGRVAVGLAAARGKKTGRAPRIIINDRLDVALAADAHGVHLGRESASAHEVVRWCRAGNAPNGFVIGVSCHSIEEAREAANAKADYILFGPVFETPSKLPFGTPQGIEKLAGVCRAVPMPVVAIGGVSQENAAACIRAGAAGIAAIRMFQDSPDTKAVTESVASIHELRGKEL